MTSNLLMACTIIGTSVFAYGFDTAVLDTIQAMTRKYQTDSLAGTSFGDHKSSFEAHGLV